MEVLEQLLERGCELEVRDAAGSLPWHYAVRGGAPALVALLLERGCRLEAPNHDGQRALHFAVQSGAQRPPKGDKDCGTCGSALLFVAVRQGRKWGSNSESVAKQGHDCY